MEFYKYSSIDNYSEKTLHDIKKRIKQYGNLSDCMFCVTEKIHGSNFSIYYEKDMPLRVAKRNSFIGDNGSFYNWQKAIDKNMLALDRIANYFYTNAIEQAIIYGELCGGHYDDMPILQGVKRIQREIQYSNDTEFVVFDIAYIENGQRIYMSQIEIEDICQEYDMPCVKHEYIGMLAGCVMYAEEHINRNSTIPNMFNMPQLESNPIEGYVIKQITGGDQNADHRIVFKIKSDKFKERKAAKSPYTAQTKYSDLPDIDEYLNINRFNSATSKYGEYSIKDFGNILQMIAEDIASEAGIENNKQLRHTIARWLSNNTKDLF